MTQTVEAFKEDAPGAQKTHRLIVFQSTDQSPLKLKPCIFPACEAFCCYDGVYLVEGEEEHIARAVSAHPEFFRHLTGEYIVDGNWYNRFKGRKTAVRPFSYKSPDYPRHFDNTRCVFAYDDGCCSLQTAAKELNLDPWHFKPMACRMFPLRYLDGRIILPPHGEEKDHDYIDEDYPGFITFLPCGRHSEEGLPWCQALRKEILHLLSLIIG